MEQNQTVALLKQDKEYLSKQINEINPRFKMVEEKLYDTAKQLDDAKRAREELYDKYLNSRYHNLCIVLYSCQTYFNHTHQLNIPITLTNMVVFTYF